MAATPGLKNQLLYKEEILTSSILFFKKSWCYEFFLSLLFEFVDHYGFAWQKSETWWKNASVS